MNRCRTNFSWALSLLLLMSAGQVFAQAIVTVRVISVEVTQNSDCDGLFSGDSDFVWEFIATDNTLGYSNNNPVLFGVLGDFNYAFQNGNNGPYTMNTPSGQFNPNDGVFFDHQYTCATDVPTSIVIDWRAYENDEPTNYSLFGLLENGETGPETGSITVPAVAGTTSQTFSAVSEDAGCPQTYRITLEVRRTPLVINYFEDNICDATAIALNTTYTLGWCSSVTLEANEPAGGDVASNGSVWFHFVAPPSGEVDITTDLGGTEFGTYFEVYHAADGAGCNAGIHPITGVIIKDKFDYLSHIEFSDGIDFLGVDPEAEITFDACDPDGILSFQKLIPGETYYVQLTSDDPGESGYYEVLVSDLGGTPPDLEDIPCLSTAVVTGVAVISSEGGNASTITLDFGCALDGGNDYGETGAPHTSNDPNEYHAYDYDHNAVNNGTVNESVWMNFVAPNSGRIVFEADYQSAIFSESSALFGYDTRFAPGTPADFNCADLENIAAADGGINGAFGGASQSALINMSCLEPGYSYYGMADPSSGLTFLNDQFIQTWLYDPSVADPSINPPSNDILCLAMTDPLFQIPVTTAGSTPSFEAVAGSNEFACREYLAGEPASMPLDSDRADQTVWHYFVAPPSGAVEMNIRAYIGLNQLNYNIYELLGGTDCYGGLNPATYTEDGTQLTPIVTPVLSGTADFDGTQESVCCMVPGTLYAIQLDGGSPGDEGQYIIEYIREVASDAGDIYVELIDGSQVEVGGPDTAYVCAGDSILPGILLNGIGETTLSLPSCLTLGYVMHSENPVPSPVMGSGFTFIDSIQVDGNYFVNDTDGSGSFGNPMFNQVYYVSPAGDDASTWGDFSCNSSTLGAGVPVVYLQPVVPVSSYDNALCEITFTANGGVFAYNGSPFNYEIYDASLNLVETGSFAGGSNIVFAVTAAELYTINVTDGACPYSFTVDASACTNPCLLSTPPTFVDTTICAGTTIFLEGANQSTNGLYTDVFVSVDGCDSTVYTTLTLADLIEFEQTFTICVGSTITVGTNTYTTSGVYTDVLAAANGCDSTVTTNLFVESVINTIQNQTICQGQTYDFYGTLLDTEGTYAFTLIAAGGCDSVINLFLTVIEPIQNSTSVNICQGQVYNFNGVDYTIAGTYSATYPAANGCDSIVTLYLNVDPMIVTSFSATICSGQSYSFGTQTLTTSGEYNELFTSSLGCDSSVTLYLFVDPPIQHAMAASICSGQTYTLGAQSLTVSGEYSEAFVAATGCDSTVTLFLTLEDAIETNLSDSICEGDEYIFGVDVLTSSGVYTQTYTAIGGCDSTVVLELFFKDCSQDFEISNILTPNNDGKNDTWMVSDPSVIQGCTVIIYNRWGQPVYETTNYQNEWDGTKEGQVLPDGVYYYSITCEGKEDLVGSINLLRFKK